MPDICMCMGDNCPLRESCYRYTAYPTRRTQSYMNPPYNPLTKDCDYHWLDSEEKRLNLTLPKNNP